MTGGSLPAAIWHDVMTAAERNLPATPLDRSDLQAIPEELHAHRRSTDETPGTAPVTTDDEAGPVRGGAQQPPSQSFWNWVFGHPPPAQTPPPAPAQTPTPPPQSDDDDDNGH